MGSILQECTTKELVDELVKRSEAVILAYISTVEDLTFCFLDGKDGDICRLKLLLDHHIQKNIIVEEQEDMLNDDSEGMQV